MDDLTPGHRIDAALRISRKLTDLVFWIIVFLFHLSLIVALLFFLWGMDISSKDIRMAYHRTISDPSFSNILGMLGFAGITLVGVFVLYVKAWKTIVRKLIWNYLFRGWDRS